MVLACFVGGFGLFGRFGWSWVVLAGSVFQ